MGAFFKKTLHDFRWTFFWYGVIAVAYPVMAASIFPTVKANADKFNDLLKTYPKALIEAFGIRQESLSTLGGYLSVEFFSLIFVVLLGLLAFSLAASFVAGEVDRGTSELTFAFPVRRSDIVLGKFGAGMVIIVAVIAASLASCLICGAVIGEHLDVAGLLALGAVLGAMGFFLLSLTTLLSSLMSSKGTVYGSAGAFLGVSYVLHVANGLTDKVAAAYPLSFFKYYGNPEILLLDAQIEFSSLGVLLGAGIVLLSIALLVADRRDL
jgi:ABC-2 type transport system permease protein